LLFGPLALVKAPVVRKSRPFWLMAAFGFACGLPLPLSGFTLRQWLSEGGLSLGAIGLSASIGLAYTLKFLWAPVLDQVRPPGVLAKLGRRRGWLAAIQPSLALAAFGLALSEPRIAPAVTVAAAALLAFFSASQDIVVDAWRIEMFPADLQGAALAAYVWGYRAALLISGALAIKLADFFGWHGALALMAALSGFSLAVTLAAPEPPPPKEHEHAAGLIAQFQGAVVAPFRDLLRRERALAILAFVMLFKLGEALAGVMLAPFYRALGFDRGAVAVANGPIALVSTLGGITAGGSLVVWLGVRRALVLTGFGQMLAMFMYVLLAYSAGERHVLFATSLTEAFAEGLADAAFLAFLSSLCSSAYAATQYALLSSLAAVAVRTLGGLSGFLAQALGWKAFYLLATFASLPAMLIMVGIILRERKATLVPATTR
jgi:PAT family beta-lactamase induction signal transducer AmpG